MKFAKELEQDLVPGETHLGSIPRLAVASRCTRRN